MAQITNADSVVYYKGVCVFEQLPPEMLQHIFKYLNTVDLGCTYLVNKKFYHLFGAQFYKKWRPACRELVRFFGSVNIPGDGYLFGRVQQLKDDVLPIVECGLGLNYRGIPLAYEVLACKVNSLNGGGNTRYSSDILFHAVHNHYYEMVELQIKRMPRDRFDDLNSALSKSAILGSKQMFDFINFQAHIMLTNHGICRFDRISIIQRRWLDIFLSVVRKAPDEFVKEWVLKGRSIFFKNLLNVFENLMEETIPKNKICDLKKYAVKFEREIDFLIMTTRVIKNRMCIEWVFDSFLNTEESREKAFVLACECASDILLTILLEKEVEPTANNLEQCLVKASEFGHEKIVECLLSQFDFNDAQKSQSFKRAFQNGHIQIVDLLFNEAHTDFMDSPWALKEASSMRNIPLVEWSLSKRQYSPEEAVVACLDGVDSLKLVQTILGQYSEIPIQTIWVDNQRISGVNRIVEWASRQGEEETLLWLLKTYPGALNRTSIDETLENLAYFNCPACIQAIRYIFVHYQQLLDENFSNFLFTALTQHELPVIEVAARSGPKVSPQELQSLFLSSGGANNLEDKIISFFQHRPDMIGPMKSTTLNLAKERKMEKLEQYLASKSSDESRLPGIALIAAAALVFLATLARR